MPPKAHRKDFDLRIVTTLSNVRTNNSLCSLDKEPISPSCSVSTSSTASIRSFFNDNETSPKKKYNPEPGLERRASQRRNIEKEESQDPEGGIARHAWNHFILKRDKAASRRLAKIRWASDEIQNKENSFSVVRLKKTASSLLRQLPKSPSNAPMPDQCDKPCPSPTAPTVLSKEPRYRRLNPSVSDDSANELLHAVENTLKATSTKSAFSMRHKRVRSKTMHLTILEAAEDHIAKADAARNQERWIEALQGYMAAAHLLHQTADLNPNNPISVKCLLKLRDAHHTYLSVQSSDRILLMGQEQERMGRNFRAYKFYMTAYNVRKEALGERHASLSIILNILAALQIKRNLLDQASDYIRQAMQLLQHLTDQDKFNTDSEEPSPSILVQQAVTIRNMGIVHEAKKQYELALDMYQMSLRLHRLSRGMEDDSVIGERSLADVLFASAMSITDDLSIDGEHCDEGMEAIVETSSNLYDISLDNKFECSEGISSSPEEARIKADVELAITLHMTGRLLARHLSKPNTAMSAYENALEWMETALGAEHPNTAAILGNIANVHRDQGNYEEAYKLYQRVLKIETNTFGRSHTEIGVTLHNLGTIEYDRGNVNQAIALFQESMKIHKEVSGIDSGMVAVSSQSIGNVCERICDYEQAFMAYEVALGVTKIVNGDFHLDVAKLHQKLGSILLYGLNSLIEAEEQFLLALSILKSDRHQLSDNHSWVNQINRSLADIKAALSLSGDAEDFPEEASIMHNNPSSESNIYCNL